jgi:hypothetical protein
MLMTEITFGLRCPDAVRYALVRSLCERTKPIKFFEMNEARSTYSLRRYELELEELCRGLPKVAESGMEIFGLAAPDDGSAPQFCPNKCPKAHLHSVGRERRVAVMETRRRRQSDAGRTESSSLPGDSGLRLSLR